MQRSLISHIIMKGKICGRPTLQSHFEGAIWFLPGSTLKTTTDSKIWSTLVDVLHHFSKIIGVESLKDIPLLDPLEYHLLRGNLRYEQNVYTWLVIIHGSWLRRKLNITREFYWKMLRYVTLFVNLWNCVRGDLISWSILEPWNFCFVCFFSYHVKTSRFQ